MLAAARCTLSRTLSVAFRDLAPTRPAAAMHSFSFSIGAASRMSARPAAALPRALAARLSSPLAARLPAPGRALPRLFATGGSGGGAGGAGSGGGGGGGACCRASHTRT